MFHQETGLDDADDEDDGDGEFLAISPTSSSCLACLGSIVTLLRYAGCPVGKVC